MREEVAMEWTITGKNIEITPAVRSYVERKLGRLGRHLPRVLAAKAEITQQKTKSPQHRFVVQATIDCNGILLRGEERSSDIYVAIDGVSDILDRQFERFKGRVYYRGRVNPTKAVAASTAEVAEAEAPSLIVRTKRFTVKPMTVEEAVEQMELLGHNFFLFINDATNRFNVVYKRRSGDYGLIDPAVD